MADPDRRTASRPQPPSGVGPPKRDADPEPGEGQPDDDVNQGSDLSFPASDPPSTSAPGRRADG